MEIDQAKKAAVAAEKLKVELLIDAKLMRREARQLRAKVTSLLPQLEEMKTDVDEFSRIKSHIRKVMPDALEERDANGQRTSEDFYEEKQA